MASFKLIACLERETGDTLTYIIFKVFDYVGDIIYATSTFIKTASRLITYEHIHIEIS